MKPNIKVSRNWKTLKSPIATKKWAQEEAQNQAQTIKNNLAQTQS